MFRQRTQTRKNTVEQEVQNEGKESETNQALPETISSAPDVKSVDSKSFVTASSVQESENMSSHKKPRLASPKILSKSKLPEKRGRARKLSNPKKRTESFQVVNDILSNMENTEDSPQLQKPGGVCEPSETVASKSQSEAVGKDGMTEGDLGVPVPIDVGKGASSSEVPRKQSPILCEDELLVKKENLDGYVIDQWCDLGPCSQPDSYSSHLILPKISDKLKVKESPDSKSTIEQSIVKQDIKPKEKTINKASLRYAPLNKVDDPVSLDNINNKTKDELSNGRHCRSVADDVKGEPCCGSLQAITEDIMSTSRASTFPVPRPLSCSLPPLMNSFNVHSALSYPAVYTAQFRSAKNETETFPRDLREASYASVSLLPPFVVGDSPSKLTLRPVSVGADEVSVSRCVQRNTDSVNKHGYLCRGQNLMNNLSLVPNYIMPSITDARQSESEVKFPFHPNIRPAINHDPRPSTFVSNCPHPGFLSQASFFPASSFPSPGMVALQQQSYFLHHMPYMPVLPTVNYSHSQDNLSAAPNIAHRDNFISVGTVGEIRNTLRTAGVALDNAGPFKPKDTLFGSPVCSENVGVTPTTTTTESEIFTNQDMASGSISIQASRPTLKPRMAGASDFLDPTRMKFGLDDDVTDEELKASRGSDSSDEDWQPETKSRSCGGERSETEEDSSENTIKSTEQEKANTWGHHPARKISRGRGTKEPVKCQICGKMFTGEYHLRRHKMSHSDVRPHQCQICQKSFKQKAHLTGHLIVHERAAAREKDPQQQKVKPEGGHKCPGRPRKTYSEKDLSCKECGKAFKTVYRLKRHEQSHTDIRPFLCGICGKGFKQTGHRNEHEANHEKTQKRFLCNLCGVVFRCRSSFNNHMRSHTVEKLRLQKGRDDKENTGPDGRVEAGEVTHTGYDCPYCTEKFATAQALNSHLETHVEVKQRRHVQPYSCDVCRRAFTYRHNLMKHKLIHKAPEKFAQFYKEKVEAHMASGKPSFKCFKCCKIFLRKETLAKHFKIHSGNKPYKCTICSRDFTQNVHLKVHMRKHTGSRPFQCKECGKSFIDSTALAKHIEYEACNSENSVYHCKICEKRHYYLGSIKQHIRREHGVIEDNIEAYILKSERTSKRRNTSEADKYSCKVCSWKFSEKCNLVRHIRRKHAALLELLNKDISTGHSDSASQLGDSVRQPKISVNAPAEPSSSDDSIDMSVDENSRQLHIDESEQDETLSSTSYNDLQENRMLKNSDRCTVDLNKFNFSPQEKYCLNASRKFSHIVEADAHQEPSNQLLKGFHKTDFVDANHSEDLALFTPDFSAKESVDVTSSQRSKINSQISEMDHGGPGGNWSSLTDINFLYNIGLVVSSKGKLSKETELRQEGATEDSDVSDDFSAFSGQSLPRLVGSQQKLPDSAMSQSHIEAALNNPTFRTHSHDVGVTKFRNEYHSAFSMKLALARRDDQSCIEREGSDKSDARNSEDGNTRRSNIEREDVGFREGSLETARASTNNLMASKNNGHSPNCEASNLTVCTNLGQKSEEIQRNDCSDLIKLNIHSKEKVTEVTNCSTVGGESALTQKSKSAHRSFTSPPISPTPKLSHAGSEMYRICETKETDQSGNTDSQALAENVITEATISVFATQTSNFDQLTDRLSGDSRVKGSALDTGSFSVPFGSYSGPQTRQLETELPLGTETSGTPLPSTKLVTEKSPYLVTYPETSQSISRQEGRTENTGTVPSPNRCHDASNEYLALTHQQRMEMSNRELSRYAGAGQPSEHNDGNTIQMKARQISDSDTVFIASNMSRAQDDYEACPTESHLKHLGLLACKDADEVKTRSYPLQIQYAAFKPWLEELVLNSRSKRDRRKKFSFAADKVVNDEKKRSRSPRAGQAIAAQPPYRQGSPKCYIELSTACSKRADRKSGPKDQSVSKCPRRTRSYDKKITSQNIWQISEASPGEHGCSGGKFTIDLENNTYTKTISCSLRTGYTRSSTRVSNANARKKSLTRAEGSPIQATAIASTPQETTESKTTAEFQNSQSSPNSASYGIISVRTLSTTTNTTAATAEMLSASANVTSTSTAAATAETADDTARAQGATFSPPSTPDSTMPSKNVFPCVACGKVFTARHQLKRHELTHTNRRPFTCDQCGKAFRQKVHLSDHIKRHQGRRPFVCAGCGKRFVLKNEMNQHIKNHCKGSGDQLKPRPLSEKPVFTISLTELTSLPQTTDRTFVVSRDSVQPAQTDQGLMTVCGQMYKAGDIISNGTITLRVVNSVTGTGTQKQSDTDMDMDTPSQQPRDNTDKTVTQTQQEGAERSKATPTSPPISQDSPDLAQDIPRPDL